MALNEIVYNEVMENKREFEEMIFEEQCIQAVYVAEELNADFDKSKYKISYSISAMMPVIPLKIDV
jgi:hypothetical protein